MGIPMVGAKIQNYGEWGSRGFCFLSTITPINENLLSVPHKMKRA
jgi:hypothetical protein